MKIGIADINPIEDEEITWLKSLESPFASYHVSDSERFQVFMLDRRKFHKRYNPSSCIKYYIQPSDNSDACLDWSKPFYLPTGTFSVDHGMTCMKCVNGFLHDASGFPALTTGLFGDEYYLHGRNYEAIEYFRYLEKEKGRYLEYQPRKYVEFMARILGKKTSPSELP